MTSRRWVQIAAGGAMVFVLVSVVAALYAVTSVSPVSVSDRSMSALLAWATFGLWISTSLLFVAATVAGYFALRDYQLQTLMGADSQLPVPRLVLAVRQDGLDVHLILNPNGAELHTTLKNIGPGPAVAPRLSIWVSPVVDRDPATVDPGPYPPFATLGPPTFQGRYDSLGSGESTGALAWSPNVMDLGAGVAAVDILWLVETTDVFKVSHNGWGYVHWLL